MRSTWIGFCISSTASRASSIVIILSLLNVNSVLSWDCDFEVDTCGGLNEISNDLDWKRYGRPTSSSLNGPSVDHTLSNEEGHYLYVDASDGRKGNKARFSWEAHVNTEPQCLTIWYHMSGGTPGTLRVWLQLSTGRKTWKLIEAKDQNNDAWRLYSATFITDDINSFNLTIEATIGSGRESDFAIDDISLEPCAAGEGQAQIISYASSGIHYDQVHRDFTLSSDTPFTCDFEFHDNDERGMCAFENVDLADDLWVRDRLDAGVPGVGPEYDSTYEDSINVIGAEHGYYLWSGWNSPQPGASSHAEVTTPLFHGSQQMAEQICLWFAYFMKGSSIGNLSVYMEEEGQMPYTIWSADGQHTEPRFWRTAGLKLNSASRSFRFRFRNTHFGGPMQSKEIALDDISVFICDQEYDFPAPVEKPSADECPNSLYCAAKCSQQYIAPNSNISRIVRGQPAVPHSWPWQIGLMTTLFGTPLKHSCGGSIIHPQYIVTAAHCVDFGAKENHVVRVGAHSVELLGVEASQVDHTVASIHVHPDWNSTTISHDIALLKLTKPIRMTKRVQPVCLADVGDVLHDGETCVVTGWGVNTPFDFNHTGPTLEPRTDNLREADVYNLYMETCKERINHPLGDDQLCAYHPEGKDTCSSDSGGPLICKQDGVWKLFGVTSFGFECGRPFLPGVYANVPYFYKWILVSNESIWFGHSELHIPGVLQDTMAQQSYIT